MAGRMVSFASNGGTTEGYLSVPDAKSGPGVIVVQEWWGLVPHIKGVADRFAREGFAALAPDLYHGEKTASPDQAEKMMMALNIARAEKDLRGAAQFLSQQQSVTGDKIGTVGFCMGGVLSLYAATLNNRVGACVVFYGIHPKVHPQLENLTGPVLGLYAANDDNVPASAIGELDAKLTALGKPHEFHIYPNTQHAFFNDTRPEVYDPRAAADAWQRTIAFLRENLEGSKQ